MNTYLFQTEDECDRFIAEAHKLVPDPMRATVNITYENTTAIVTIDQEREPEAQQLISAIDALGTRMHAE